MTTKLVIFCTSPRPDPYFNIICHAKSHLGISRFVFVLIDEKGGKGAQEAPRNLNDELNTFVDELEKGFYINRAGREPLEDHEKYVQTITNIDFPKLDIRTIDTTEDDIVNVLREQVNDNAAFDVTAAKNSIVAGTVAWLASRGGSTVYTFDLLKIQTYGQRDLWPVLNAPEYRYRNLAESTLVYDATQHVRRFRMSRRTFFAIASILAALMGLLSMTLSDTWLYATLTVIVTFTSISSTAVYFIEPFFDD